MHQIYCPRQSTFFQLKRFSRGVAYLLKYSTHICIFASTPIYLRYSVLCCQTKTKRVSPRKIITHHPASSSHAQQHPPPQTPPGPPPPRVGKSHDQGRAAPVVVLPRQRSARRRGGRSRHSCSKRHRRVRSRSKGWLRCCPDIPDTNPVFREEGSNSGHSIRRGRWGGRR